ncbi:LuxR C-terminal-related transcriptional regulator [Streptomyces gibsoniae]|uniref:LuxR C-terminal-related transcriptional regulator n=1 Tax=Streptomyces gibsoniae TaxID=3075529 RepID=A0ABU2TV55_9ACTN|nr:LuxR C-terminal-related transcriptional regulator [Streptomyces sp. DSM 41699]MDT0464799.1 LuxR C-terminal-related transcriptional regulator [Streptomyces sp. DSM 41699]
MAGPRLTTPSQKGPTAVSARPARVPATLPLTPAQLRIVRRIADGESTATIATQLSITIGTINVQVQHCGQKLGVTGRAAVVHACFVTGQLPRPEKAVLPGVLSKAEAETWRMVASGMTSLEVAEQAGISRGDALGRIRALRERVRADNDPHLVKLGWSHEVLDESLTEMASGTVLRAPVPR